MGEQTLLPRSANRSQPSRPVLLRGICVIGRRRRRNYFGPLTFNNEEGDPVGLEFSAQLHVATLCVQLPRAHQLLVQLEEENVSEVRQLIARVTTDCKGSYCAISEQVNV